MNPVCDICGAVLGDGMVEVHDAWHKAVSWLGPLKPVSDDLLPTQGQRVELGDA